MKIDYHNSRLVTKTVDFEGETEDGKGFTITANWNDWDDWSVDEVTWHDQEGNEDEVEQIKEEFLAEMN
jgi:hypothetical protein